MVGEVFAGLSAFKTMFDMAKALKDISDATIRNGAVIDLQGKILAAQEAQSTLIERVRELEKEVADLKAWDAEKIRYELTELAPGAVSYVLKESMRNGEPIHWLCARCFQHSKKGFLQSHRQDGSYFYHKCDDCSAEVRIPRPKTPPAKIAVLQTDYF